MADTFTIDVTYKEEQLSFEVTLSSTGYTHSFHVLINGIEVTYEPDEERNYRAMVNPEKINELKEKDKELIQLVVESLDKLKEI